MSLAAADDFEFGDGSYHFALPLPQLVELEDKCATTDTNGVRRRKGCLAIYRDLIAGLGLDEGGNIVVNPLLAMASGFEAREVIRLALEGGGRGIVDGANKPVDAIEARKLIQRYIDPAPIVERVILAAAIMKVAVEGREEPKKKAVTTEKPRPRARKTRST